MNHEGAMPGANTACPSCRAVGADRTGDHLMHYENGNRYCTRCEVNFNVKTGVVKNAGNASREVLMEGAAVFGDISERSNPHVPAVSNEPPVQNTMRHWYRHSIPWRNLSVDVLDKYGYEIAVHADATTEAVSHHLYDDSGVIGRKIRIVDTKEFKVEGNTAGKKIHLFGQDIFPAGSSKRIILTEGQEDAMSCRMATEKYNIPCVSVPLGANIKAVADNSKYLHSFDEVIFCGDMDEPGRDFAADVAGIFPHMKDVRLPVKDANKMLEDGRIQELGNLIWCAEGFRPEAIVDISSLMDSIRSPVELGLPTPWDNVNDITYGFRQHSIVSLGAAASVGKTIFVRGIQQHFMLTLGINCMVVSLEENAEATLRNMVGYMLGIPIHKPEQIYNPDDAVKMAKTIEPYLRLYDSRFFGGRWLNIKTAIRAMVVASGVRVVFIDPVSSLVAHLNSSEANTALGEIMMDMQELVKELPVCVVMVNHLNNKTSGTPHEAGGIVLPSEFTGSRAQQRYSDLMIGLERNTLSEDEEEKNTTCVRNIKSRIDGGLQGKKAYLKYDNVSGLLSAVAPPVFSAVVPPTVQTNNYQNTTGVTF